MSEQKATNITWQEGEVTRQQRHDLLGQTGATIWFTGLSGAGKSTIADRVEQLLTEQGRKVLTLDGDVVRSRMNPPLGFSIEDIYENNRRFVALCQGSIAEYDVILVPKMSNFRSQRAIARR